MVEIYGDRRQRERRQEGELRGKVQTIEGFVASGVPGTTHWSTLKRMMVSGVLRELSKP